MSSKVVLYSPTGHPIDIIKIKNMKFTKIIKIKGFLTTQFNGEGPANIRYYGKPFAKKIKLISYKIYNEIMYRLPVIVRVLTFN